MDESFLARLVALVSDIEKTHAGSADIRLRCGALASRARSYGLISEFEIGAFVLCGFVVGMDFDAKTNLPYYWILQQTDTPSLIKGSQLRLELEKLAQCGNRQES